MTAWTQEPMATAIARADGTVRFTLPPGAVMTGPYDPGAYVLNRDTSRVRGIGLTVEADQVEVRFPDTIEPGDTIEVPDVDIAEGD